MRVIVKAVAALVLAPWALSLRLDKRTAIEDCLESSGVPAEAHGSPDWQTDTTPFNLRLKYTPIAVAAPTTVRHIQDAVACAAKLGIKATAKCGGHSYASFGLGGEDGHLIIQLDRMNAVVLDSRTGIATVGGGSRLGHVASELYSQGKRAISHGTCPGVGVGGHVLHGGYGMSSHTKGLALDWLVGATVVLANSTVVTCSKNENPDLFWAIRGAGSSMGVVAEFRFKTFEAPTEVTYFIAQVPWKRDTAVEGFKSLQEYVNSQMPSALNMRLVITRQFANLEGLYYGDKAGLREALAPVLKATGAKLQLSQADDWLGQLKHFGGGLSLDQTRPYRKTENFYSSSLYSPALDDKQIKGFVDYWFTEGKATRRDWYVQIDLHGGTNSAVASPSVDSTAYANRHQLLMMLFYDRVDARSQYPADGYPFLSNFVKSVTATMAGEGWGRYANYPDSGLDPQVAQRAYWGLHLDRLRKIKAEVDPEDVFHYPQGVQLPAKGQ
ncbi:glucooligosaccharide oxidase [Magnaporthiopsis poae ATCC 64411]|uniref:Glucooligosaccharide oxidase n=1 Tax=Magnaporthiopsis poae (strain ATCC 64411 / 73-15) TaxID=644358 RepID=A0A0C4DWP5_MAGP6|nr:glucooligosaccharide oxidase [Magnaporthiopsis poae ATCC 64411]